LALSREERTQVGYFAQVRRQFDELAADYVAQALNQLGWQPRLGESLEVEAWATKHGVSPRYTRLLRRLLAICAEEKWFQLRGAESPVQNLPTSSPADTRRELFLKQFPEFEDDFRLVDHCGSSLARVLRGEEDPLQVLFGAGAELVERMYERS